MIFYIPTSLADELIDPRVSPEVLAGLNGWMQAGLGLEDETLVAGQRGPITRWLTYAFGSAFTSARPPKSVVSSVLPVQPGDPNPFFQVIDAAHREKATVEIGQSPDALTKIGPVSRSIWAEPSYGVAAVAVGGDVEGMRVYIRVADLTEQVPESFPDRVYTVQGDDPEAEPVEAVHTWATYNSGVPGHNPNGAADGTSPQAWDGYYYVPAVNTWLAGRRGSPLPASDWVPSYMAQAFDVLSEDRYHSVRESYIQSQ